MDWLEQQPPPSKRAKAGFYPDPLHTGRARYWDGKQWTLQMGPKVGADASMGKEVPPPQKSCPRCGTVTETYEGSCPNCGRSYGRLSGGALAAVIAGSILATIVFVGGCAGLIVLGVNEAEEEADEHSITRAEWESVRIGTPQKEVERRLGTPWERDDAKSIGGDPLKCIYYYEEGASIFDVDNEFGLCFNGGVLVSKTLPGYDPDD